MNLSEAKSEIKKLLNEVKPSDVSRLLTWIRSSDEFDDFLSNNQTKILQNIAEDLRGSLPLDAMLSSENTAYNKMQQCSRPTVHVDSFLYDEDQVDSLCEEGTMSRSYCLTCGSHRTAPLDFISHSFSISELRFLFENVLPDLNGRLLVDVGSRLGAVLYGVLHTDVLLQNVLLQKADILIMNNVFEFFMELSEQVRAWRLIMENFRKKGSLLVSVPGLQESLNSLQETLQPGWVEELPVDHSVYLDQDSDPEALRQIHLYRVL
ncbi:uncharacterized protein LOC116377668 isoform X2 [Anarrhichthys ocellatus]|uniref:uncharacterized protein LOC116377668 isoform X2 n=1 Tax=Anarrhichthys ocellatus TaxID=433405 RepID=UPI0012ED3803|nr:uncharacterized protein LOC116377668 isoform X2 [Anarrhichthys ocellatus]